MCLLPIPNTDYKGLAYSKGVTEFDCGACPECLKKRSNVWALRAVYEAKEHLYNCMVTLTYDNFERDKSGKIIGELPVNPNLVVNKRDIQLFIKRLRKWCASFSSEKIKYIACAEYGKSTHRAHYHLILFGVRFPDMHFYKKSKRGNFIYMSNTLSKLWNHGICTIDSISVRAGVAMYCTKYCAKSRADNTFMLCSQSVGLNSLLREFNGKSYFVDGREFAIPRFIWQRVITSRHLNEFPFMDYRYCNRTEKTLSNGEFERNREARRLYRSVRDGDSLYKGYLDYWSARSSCFDKLRLTPRERILALDDSKFHNYKVASLDCLDRRLRDGISYVAPGSNCVSAYLHDIEESYRSRCRFRGFGHLPDSSRHNRASDTILSGLTLIYDSSPFD